MGKANKRGQVAEEIRTIRRTLGLRLDDVAEVAGVSRALVGHVERGLRSDATEGGDKIARAIQLLADMNAPAILAEMRILERVAKRRREMRILERVAKRRRQMRIWVAKRRRQNGPD